MKTSALAPRACPCGGYSTWKTIPATQFAGYPWRGYSMPACWRFIQLVNVNLFCLLKSHKIESCRYNKGPGKSFVKVYMTLGWVLLKSPGLNRGLFSGALSWQILHELQGLNTFLVHADDLEIQQGIPDLDRESPQNVTVVRYLSTSRLYSFYRLQFLVCWEITTKKWYAMQKMQVKKLAFFFGEQIQTLYNLSFSICMASLASFPPLLISSWSLSFGWAEVWPLRKTFGMLKRTDRVGGWANSLKIRCTSPILPIHSGISSPCFFAETCIPRWQHLLNQAGWLGTKTHQVSFGVIKGQSIGQELDVRCLAPRCCEPTSLDSAHIYWRNCYCIQFILLMEEILHHLLHTKPYETWDILHINWCRISSINSSLNAYNWINSYNMFTNLDSLKIRNICLRKLCFTDV